MLKSRSTHAHGGAPASSPPPITADERRNPAALFNSLSTLALAHTLFFFFFFVPCVTNFTHFPSLSRIVKDLIRAFPVLIVIRTVIVRAIKGNWATAEWKSP